MKIDKQTIIMGAFLIAFVICMIYGVVVRRISGKTYALGYVHDLRSVQGPGPRGDYVFTIKGKSYNGSIGNGNVNIHKYFIVVYVKDRPRLNGIEIEIPINPKKLNPQPPEGWDECPINEDGTIKEKYKRSNDPWYSKKARYVVGEAMDTNMRYIYRFKWRYASVPNVEIGKHYMLKINADDLKQYELASTVPIDTSKLQIQTNGGWEECPVTKEGAIKENFKRKN